MKARKHLNIRLPYLRIPIWWPDLPANWHAWLPSRGNALFTLLVVAGLLWATNAGALPLRAPTLAGDSTTTISYQGRLADSAGNPITTPGVAMQFRLYNSDTGGAPLWEETHAAVPVEDGLFHVLLGSINPIPVSLLANNSTLWLGITVGSDSEMTPREQIASVPYAMIASTVPDGSVTTAKIADGAVTSTKLDVDSGLEVSGNLTVRGGSLTVDGASAANTNLSLNNDRTNINDWELRTGTNGFFIQDSTAGEDRINISNEGNVGIGAWATASKLHVAGSFTATGLKSSVVTTTHHGARKLYAVESPEVWFIDQGKTGLVNGQAYIRLDPVFLETIEGDLLIHVTPYGDASLYVAEIGEDHVVIRGRDGDPNVAFAWWIGAHRKGYARVRLESTTFKEGD